MKVHTFFRRVARLRQDQWSGKGGGDRGGRGGGGGGLDLACDDVNLCILEWGEGERGRRGRGGRGGEWGGKGGEGGGGREGGGECIVIVTKAPVVTLRAHGPRKPNTPQFKAVL